MYQEFEGEKLAGKYKIIIALITAATAIITSIIGAVLGAKYAPIEVNVNLDGYISRTQDELASWQTTGDENTSNDLQDAIIDTQKDNADQQQQIIKLERENDGLRSTIERQNKQLITLDQEKSELLNQIAEKDTQITALEQERKELLNTISEKDRQIFALSLSSDSPNVDSNQTSKESVKLTSLILLGNKHGDYNFVYNSSEDKGDAKSNLGEVFNSSISMRRNGDIDFYLGCSYKTLNATISISESTKDIYLFSSTLTIYSVNGYGDTETRDVLYKSPALAMGFIPAEIGPIDVSGVEHLRISFYSKGSTRITPRIVLGNPELVPIQ